MRKGKDNTWRGLIQPKREQCPACSKRGLGPIKCAKGGQPHQHCRYCGKDTYIALKSTEESREAFAFILGCLPS